MNSITLYLKKTKIDIKKLLKEPLLLSVITLIGISLFLFVILPLYKIFQISLVEDGHFTLATFWKLLSKSYNRRPLFNSLKLGATVSFLGTVIGFIFAYAITRVEIPFKKFFRVVATFPIVSPPFVISLAAIMLFGNNGLITKHLFNGYFNFEIYGFNGLVLVETLAYFPTAFLVLFGVLQAIDPALEDAALDLGASKGKVFRTITLPLATPGIASALLLVFTQSLADFGNPMIISGNYSVLSVQAYLRITGMYDLKGGAALALLLLIPSLIAFFLQKYWVSKKSYVTVTGKPSASRIKTNEPAIKYSVLGTCFFLTGVILLFYGMVIGGSFVKVWGANHALTLDNYRHVFTVGWEFIKDTLILSSIATPISGILGMVIAFLVVRKRFPGKGLMEVVSLLSFAVPGTVVGIGYILAFNQRPLLLTGTASIIIILFIFRRIPVGIRAGIAELQQIDPYIEEASTDLGAGSATTFRKITLPMITPAFFSGLAFSFVKCMTAISAIIFVVSGKWNLITVAILGSVENADLSQAAAFSITIIIFILLALGLIQVLVDRMAQGKRITLE
jgi:iron(III) transport system permease protein